MVAYSRRQLERVLKIDFIRFCIVGGTGFVINFLILTCLHNVLNFPIAVAQLVGAEVALFSNFLLHHHWTYKRNKVNKSLRTLLGQFHMTSWPAILGSTLMVSASVNIIHLNEFVALVISSVIALLWNFIWSKYVIWRDVSFSEAVEIIK